MNQHDPQKPVNVFTHVPHSDQPLRQHMLNQLRVTSLLLELVFMRIRTIAQELTANPSCLSLADMVELGGDSAGTIRELVQWLGDEDYDKLPPGLAPWMATVLQEVSRLFPVEADEATGCEACVCDGASGQPISPQVPMVEPDDWTKHLTPPRKDPSPGLFN